MFFYNYYITLRHWLILHWFHEKEVIIEKKDNKDLRFIKCWDCGESFYDGEIKEM